MGLNHATIPRPTYFRNMHSILGHLNGLLENALPKIAPFWQLIIPKTVNHCYVVSPSTELAQYFLVLSFFFPAPSPCQWIRQYPKLRLTLRLTTSEGNSVPNVSQVRGRTEKNPASLRLSTCTSSSQEPKPGANTRYSVSDQLYQNPSHFLLELIQNADDTTFSPGVIPSLSLTLFSESDIGYLRTDCNEAGFTFADIDAITQVGQSTKKGATNGQRGYIGEKGIGFKSVFKAADIVHVASGHYEFKFDRNEHLGMILPIRSAFPSTQRLVDHTQFLLQLRDKEDCAEIEGDLHTIEPQLLIFLKNLRGLNIQIADTRKSYHIEGNTSAALGEIVTIHSNQEGEVMPGKMEYSIARYRTSEIPKDVRREGITTSEVVLAFPIEHSKPKISPQKAFAFLPIDDFGFKVCCNGREGKLERGLLTFLIVVPYPCRFSTCRKPRRRRLWSQVEHSPVGCRSKSLFEGCETVCRRSNELLRRGTAIFVAQVYQTPSTRASLLERVTRSYPKRP